MRRGGPPGRRGGGDRSGGYAATTGPTQRTLVSTKRSVGTVLDWRGKFGWIQPLEPVEHPQARRMAGLVFLTCEDVQEEINGVGTHVSFFAYADANGVGAMNVRLATGEALALAEAAGPLPAPVMPPLALTQHAHSEQHPDEDVPLPATGSRSGARGPKQYGGYRASRKSVRADPEDVLTRVHDVLYKKVEEAAEAVSHLEKDWAAGEITRKAMKYFYKPAHAPELLAMQWIQATRQYVEHALQGFAAGCGDKVWFFEIDLAPALVAAAWEIVKDCELEFAELEQVVMSRYEELMDATLLDKAMWQAAEATFGHGSVCSKVYKGLHTTHEPAFKDACAEPRKMPDLQRVEVFTRNWMENSMSRAWQAIENSPKLLSQETIVRLFQNLLAPFGDEHPFSCVPAALTQRIGRPPRDWPFLWNEARRLCLTWGQPASAPVPFALPPPKKRRRAVESISTEPNGASANYTAGGNDSGDSGESDDELMGKMLPPVRASLVATLDDCRDIKHEATDPALAAMPMVKPEPSGG